MSLRGSAESGTAGTFNVEVNSPERCYSGEVDRPTALHGSDELVERTDVHTFSFISSTTTFAPTRTDNGQPHRRSFRLVPVVVSDFLVRG